MNLPYRNTVKRDKNFKINIGKEYYNDINYKPNGLWYEIKDCLFQWGELTWGEHIYSLELKRGIINKPKGLLSIQNYEQFVDFNKKYSVKHKYKEISVKIFTLINWKKVSKEYGGFEIKNYLKIKSTFSNDSSKTPVISWLSSFDFSSGCIWDLDLLKKVEYYKKI